MEEERGQEISKIVKELLPSPKISAVSERQSQSRRVRILLYIMIKSIYVLMTSYLID